MDERQGCRYRHILMDIDMTLMDFDASERQSLDEVLLAYGVEPSQELGRRYHEINQGLWGEFEQGRIEKTDIMRLRFARLFREMGMEVDGVQANEVYRSHLRESAILLPGADGICRYLSSRYGLHIVTNGWADTQYRRLELSGLAPYFRQVFVSEEAGCQKPQKEFFDYCLSKIGDVARWEVLIVGDSLGSDIRGGNLAGIDTCWFNPQRIPRPSGFRIDHEIHSLEELRSFL